MKKFLIAAAASLVAIGLAIPSSAFASHFRSSYGNVSIAGTTLTWSIDEAWRKGSDDTFGGPSILSVPSPTTSPVTPPDGGDSTAYSVTSLSPTNDYSNPLYDSTNETHTFDLSTITDDGTYEMYASSCCRVGDVQNTDGNDDFSQWIRFSKSGSTYNLPPNFNNPSLYLLIKPGVATSADFTANDPEGGSVTYTAITDSASPYMGGHELACSTLVNGLLTLDPSLCTNGDVFADIYTPGSFWTAKVQASDAQGNTSVVDTLFRVMTPPEPYINDANPVGNGLDYQFEPIAEDTIVDSWTITCTNTLDPTDVVTGTSPTAPFTMGRFTNGASYSCDVDATNAAGTGSDAGYGIGPMVLVGVDLQLDLAVGANFQGADTVISGGGLKAGSQYDLTMHSDPIIIDQGVTDSSGNFTNTVHIPAEACLVGVHQLILTGIDPDGNPVSDTQWVELGMNCDVLQLSRTEITPSFDPSLPDTGVVWATFIGVALLGGFLFLLAGGTFGTKGRLRAAGIDLQLKQKLDALNASLERMERQRRIRRNRK
jgi:hypothetical protein